MNKLMLAIENGNSEESIKLLKENSELIFKKSEDGWNVLQLAAYYNLPKLATYFIDNSSYEDINGIKVHPLLIAIEEKNESVIQAFLDYSDSSKINWNVKDKSGNNLIYLAVHYGLNNIVESLLKKDISCHDQNSQGLSAFSLVIDKGDSFLFDKMDEYSKLSENYSEILIKKCIQHDHVHLFERIQPYTEISPDELFNLSSGFSSIKIMNELMQSGDVIPGREQVTKIVDLMCMKYENEQEIQSAKELADYLFEVKVPFSNFTNDRGQSAWMLCIQNDNEEVFERLMQSSENVNVIDSESHSPLFYAIEKNNNRFVKMLLKKKANPNQLDRQKNSPLMKAVEKGNLEMVKEILKYCQNINDLNSVNEHALSIAIKQRRMDIVTELIWAGGEISSNPIRNIEEKHIFFVGTSSGSPSFQSYHQENCVDDFVALTKLGFRLDQKNEEGDTFLLHFIKNGYLSNFSSLLRCQFNPNQFDSEGNSAIMCAAQKRQDEYFFSIMRKFSNIDFSHKNNQGENLYDLCFKSGKSARMEILVKYDDNLSLNDAMKASKLIAKDGNLSDYAEKLQKTGLNLSFEDESKNNLLMFSLIGGNLNNFKYLIETIGVSVDLKHTNKNGNTIEDIINAMPEEYSQDFKSYLNKNLKKKIIN